MNLFALGIKRSSVWKRLGGPRALRDKLESTGGRKGAGGFDLCR